MSGVRNWHERAAAFAHDARILFGRSEGSYSARVYNAHESLARVAKLSFDQADSFKQAVRCVEAGLYRAAFVMAWTALADLVLILGAKEQSAIRAVRPKWKFVDKQTLCDEQGDYAIILALKEARVISKLEMKSLHGLLHRRNQCAHPSNYFPSANEALGYIDEAIGSARKLVAVL